MGHFQNTQTHSPLARVVFGTINGKVHKLLKAMYGLRDAGKSFDRDMLGVMNLMGVSLGVGQARHLCWIPEGAGHVGRIGAPE